MILIQSIEGDVATNEVIDWLLFQQIPFVRINDSDLLTIEKLVIENEQTKIIFSLNGKSIDLETISAFWYRRGSLILKKFEREIIPNSFNMFTGSIIKELGVISEYLNQKLTSIHHLNKYEDNNLSKLIQLEVAASCDLKIPNTEVTSSLPKALDKRPFITKAIYTNHIHINENWSIGGPTVRVTEEHRTISGLPSLIQEEIKKKYEIRAFYLAGEFYCTAIFSQNNPNTQIDFRNYDRSKPNRVVPFILPNEIKKKLIRVMKKLDLNCGSIDLIVSKDQQYYFLEVNPIGQFSQVSIPGNYNLEKKIMDFLKYGS